MKITREELRRIIRESLLNEDSIADVANINSGDIASGIFKRKETMEVIAANFRILKDAVVEINQRLLILEQKGSDQ